MMLPARGDQWLDRCSLADRDVRRAEIAAVGQPCSGRPSSAGNVSIVPSIGASCCLSLAACTTSAATTSRLPAATTACALSHGSNPPPATGMMRDASSVRLIGSVGKGVSTGGWGGLPADFLPEAAALASRAASLAW